MSYMVQQLQTLKHRFIYLHFKTKINYAHFNFFLNFVFENY